MNLVLIPIELRSQLGGNTTLSIERFEYVGVIILERLQRIRDGIMGTAVARNVFYLNHKVSLSTTARRRKEPLSGAIGFPLEAVRTFAL